MTKISSGDTPAREEIRRGQGRAVARLTRCKLLMTRTMEVTSPFGNLMGNVLI